MSTNYEAPRCVTYKPVADKGNEKKTVTDTNSLSLEELRCKRYKNSTFT
jgi:hypothetical protein